MLSSWFAEAKQLHLKDALDEAEEFYKAILKAQPNHIDAKHLLGLLRYQQGRDDEALRLIQQVLKANPGIAPAYVNLANVLRRLGRAQEALANCTMALAIKPDYLEALVNHAGMLLDLGRPAEALTSLDKALLIDPGYVEALNNRGNALRVLKRHEEAMASYDRALQIKPNNAEAFYNRGIALYELRRLEDAVVSYDQALRIKPDFVQAHNNRGNALRELRRPKDALESYDRALAIKPDHVSALNNRGNVLRDLNRVEEALTCYDRAIAIDRRFADAYNNRGDALNELGRPGEARRAFEQSIELKPTATAFYANLANTQTFKAGDPLIARMEALAAAPDSQAPADCAKLNFALGKAYADIRDYRQAFERLSRGAKAKRSLIDYDETATMRFFDRIEAVFTDDFIRSRAGSGDPSQRPIFIVGMPRSGTTLVEQILASHPDVFGAGELTAMNDATTTLAAGAPGRNGAIYPEYVAALNPADFQALGAEYVDRIRSFASDTVRLTDKMPSNFYFLGLIHLALPNARIIHTLRDPADTCVSCFSILFSDEQTFTYDLGELGRYYRRYQQLMAHWRRVLPEGSFIDILYEDVVANTEAEARRLLAYCDLPWDDGCLSFHQTQRTVKTASAAQVRQPIYTSAIKRWRVYEDFLGPLLTELGMSQVSRDVG